MSSEELAEALIAARGSYTPEPKRLPQAIGLVRAAVDAELSRGGDARLAIHRFKSCDTVLVGRQPDDPTSTTTAADLLGYVVRLGRRASDLVDTDPLPTRQRAVEALRALRPPEAMPPLSDLRLLQLAAVASSGAADFAHGKRPADVNSQGQLYPIGMPAARALRMAMGSLIGQTLSPDDVRGRVATRFPRAEKLPGRTELDDLLRAATVPLLWHDNLQKYGPVSVSSSMTGTRTATSYIPLLGPTAADDVDARLASVIDRRGFLAVLAPIRRFGPARRALLDRLELSEVDVTGIMLDRLRTLGFPWEAIVAADNGSPADPDFRSLVELVAHHVVPTIVEALAETDRSVLITEAAPLARYGQLRLIQELADPTRPRPAARLLLVPARRAEPALLDTVQLPLTSPASQALWLADAWLTSAAARAA